MDHLRDKVAVDIGDDRPADLAGKLDDRALPHRADVSDPQAFEGIRDAASRRFRRVDVVVNNVGVLTNGLPQDIPVAEWQRILDVNLMSVVCSGQIASARAGSGRLHRLADLPRALTERRPRMFQECPA